MKGDAIPVEMILMVFGVVTALLLFVTFTTHLVLAIAPECWKKTLKDIDKLTAETQLGFGKLLGLEEFYLPVSISADCGNSIEFTDYKGCIKECQDYGESEKCQKECLKCEKAQTCIVATPIRLSKWRAAEAWNIFFDEDGENKYLKKLRFAFGSLLKAYSTSYQFEGVTTIDAPKKGTSNICLHFKRALGSTVYGINSVDEDMCVEASKPPENLPGDIVGNRQEL